MRLRKALGAHLNARCPRGTQVSRRLTRRIKHALYNKQFGYVEIAVHAYVRLLNKSAKDDSTFSFGYFSKELVHQPDTVVRLGGMPSP